MNIPRAAAILMLASLVPSSPGFAGIEECEVAFDDEDWPLALNECRPLAEQGDASAQMKLGHLFKYGWGTPQDDAEAVKWYRQAAEQGYAGAQFNLGLMYKYGPGIKQDYAEAMRLFRLAADQGNAGAQINLGFMYNHGQGVLRDYVQAHMWLNLAVAQGNERSKQARDTLANRMTPEQIAEAQRLAHEWKPKDGAE